MWKITNGKIYFIRLKLWIQIHFINAKKLLRCTKYRNENSNKFAKNFKIAQYIIHYIRWNVWNLIPFTNIKKSPRNSKKITFTKLKKSRRDTLKRSKYRMSLFVTISQIPAGVLKQFSIIRWHIVAKFILVMSKNICKTWKKIGKKISKIISEVNN